LQPAKIKVANPVNAVNKNLFILKFTPNSAKIF